MNTLSHHPLLNILLVEDHDSTRAALLRILIHHGYGVISASNAAEAKELIEQYRFNVVISDIGLPDQSGLELMVELKRVHPYLSGIALTAYSSPDDFERTRKAGFSAHLVKPINFNVLEKTILEFATPPLS